MPEHLMISKREHYICATRTQINVSKKFTLFGSVEHFPQFSHRTRFRQKEETFCRIEHGIFFSFLIFGVRCETREENSQNRHRTSVRTVKLIMTLTKHDISLFKARTGGVTPSYRPSEASRTLKLAVIVLKKQG